MGVKESIEMEIDIKKSNLRQLDFKIKALKRLAFLTDYQREYLDRAMARYEQLERQNKIILGD